MDMSIPRAAPGTNRYAKCIEVSKRIRWDIDRDLIRGREFDFTRKFLPDGLSMAARLPFLTEAEKRTFSQVQGRTYANMFGLVERFIGAKILEVSRDHWMGDQVALEALVRFTDEELKHQELFRRIEVMMAAGMPEGYTFLPQPNDVARAVLASSTWSVRARPGPPSGAVAQAASRRETADTIRYSRMAPPRSDRMTGRKLDPAPCRVHRRILCQRDRTNITQGGEWAAAAHPPRARHGTVRRESAPAPSRSAPPARR